MVFSAILVDENKIRFDAAVYKHSRALLMLTGISLAHVGAEFGKFREVDADVAAEQRVKIVNAGCGGNGGEVVTMINTMQLTCWPRCGHGAFRTLAEACTSSADMPNHYNRLKVLKLGVQN
jgi:hypothetical protein